MSVSDRRERSANHPFEEGNEMRTKLKVLGLAAVGALLLLAAIAGLAETGGAAAPQAAPGNQSPPTISGTTQEGSTLTTSNGTWSGSPTSFTYQWRRCDSDGGSCATIGGATDKTYVLKKVDVDNTIRSRVTARNADGSTQSTSVPTAVVRAAPVAPSGCDANGPIPIAGIALPNRLSIDGQAITPTVVGQTTQSISLRFHVTCKGKPVQGALVYADAVPFNQFTTPAEQLTGADGWATLTMNRDRGFPAARSQELLVIFARARKAGEDLLGGVSTRRLVSFPVDLRR
jgi:hypothetical protein